MILCITGYQAGTSKRSALYRHCIGDRIHVLVQLETISFVAATPMARSRRGGALEVVLSSNVIMHVGMYVCVRTHACDGACCADFGARSCVRRNDMQVDPHSFRLKRDFENPIRETSTLSLAT